MKKIVWNDKLSLITCFFITVIVFAIVVCSVFSNFPDDIDFDSDIATECIAKKIEKGYPEDFANEYCKGISKGCYGKVYEEDCDPEVKCCFVTIEEDKKWNYLDYDEKGNKIN